MIDTPDVASQVAALPFHWDMNGKLRILMITSRDRGRWVMPKGWLMNGKHPWQAAKIEALEEAGAIGFVLDQPIGTYRYEKRLRRGRVALCRVNVYPMLVDRLNSHWKEQKERNRHWFSVEKSAKLVDEPELSELLRRLAVNPERILELEEFRSAA